MIAAILDFLRRWHSSKRHPSTNGTHEVIADAQEARLRMKQHARSRRHEVAAVRLEEMRLRQTIRQNFLEAEILNSRNRGKS